MILWKENQIMYWHDGVAYFKVTDHNREPLDVSIEEIAKKTRMADGTLRKYVVARKRNWSLSWNNLPSRTQNGALNTVDGGMDGETMEQFYNNTPGEFQIKVRSGDGAEEVFLVMFSEFSKNIVKRGERNDLWDVSVTLEEV